MSQNKSLTIILVLLGLAIGIIVKQSFKVQDLKSHLDSRNIDLKRKDKQLRLKGDSIRLMETKNADLDSLWSGIVKDQLAALEQERAKTAQMRIKYEKLQHTPAVHYSQHDLDSIVLAIITRRRQH